MICKQPPKKTFLLNGASHLFGMLVKPIFWMTQRIRTLIAVCRNFKNKQIKRGIGFGATF